MGRPVGVEDVGFVVVEDEGAEGVGELGEEEEGAGEGVVDGGGWGGFGLHCGRR